MQVFNATGRPGAPNKHARQAVNYFLEAYKKDFYPGPLQVPSLCEKYGLEEIALEIYPTDHFPDLDRVRAQGKLFLAGACAVMMGTIVEVSGVAKAEVEGVIQRAMGELESRDLVLRTEMQVFVWRKGGGL